MLLVDDAVARTFEPFATTRPLSAMRVGAMLVRERWQQVLRTSVTAVISAPHLRGFVEWDEPGMWHAEAAAPHGPSEVWVVNTRAIPFLDVELPGDCRTLVLDGTIAAMRLPAGVLAQHADALAGGAWPFAVADVPAAARVEVQGVWLHHVWDIIAHLVSLLQRDIPVLAATLGALARVNTDGQSGPHAVYVEDGATVEPMVFFDTTAGPVLLRRESHVQAFTRIVGPCYVGVGSTVTTDRVAASAIGDMCRVHGELSTSVLIGHSNKGHDGFVGHSILGRWVNLGAGTITSNLKNTYGPVALWTPQGVRDTGLQFLGTMFGDHAKTGIGMRLTTGCVLGAGANVFDRMPPKAVPPFAWGASAPYQVFDFAKFADTASRMMARRQVTLTDAQRQWWQDVHQSATHDARWPRD